MTNVAEDEDGLKLVDQVDLTDPRVRKQVAALPNRERQARVEKMLIRYPAFEDTLREIGQMHRPVRDGTPANGSICGIIGASRAGKSTAIRHYVASQGNVPPINADGDKVVAPKIVYVNARKEWGPLDLGMALVRKITGQQLRPRNAEMLFNIVIEEVAHCGIEMVVVDDAQWLVASRMSRTVSQSMSFFIGLAEAKVCNVLLAGLPSIRPAVEQVDSAFNRGAFPHWNVAAYDWNDPEERDEFCFMLDDIDEMLPFVELSGLAHSEIASHLYRLSGGLVGLVMVFVQAAAFQAISDGSDRIMLAHLREAAETRRRLNDRYVPFGGRLSDEEVAAGADLITIDDGDEEAPPLATLHKKRKKRSGIR